MSGIDPTAGSGQPPPPPAGAFVPPGSPPPPTAAYAAAPGPSPETGDPFFQRLFDFSFARFVTPSLIKLLYILAIVSVSLVALFMLFGGLATISDGGFVLVLVAPIFWLLGVIWSRVILELIIILFRVESNTRG